MMIMTIIMITIIIRDEFRKVHEVILHCQYLPIILFKLFIITIIIIILANPSSHSLTSPLGCPFIHPLNHSREHGGGKGGRWPNARTSCT